MRRAVYLFILMIAAVVLRNLPLLLGPEVWSRITLPYRLARLAAQPPDTSLVIPVQGVTSQAIANTWHARRDVNRRHEGQDIFAPAGTPVLSAARGIVTRLGQNSLGGNVVWVAGAGSRTYYYAHLQSWAEHLSVGTAVAPVSVIGYVGNTGNARGTPPHLHFGIYTRAGAIDPLPLLAATVPVSFREAEWRSEGKTPASE